MRIPGPETRVVELRVHGILGTTGAALTDSVASVDVAGDGVGRVVRPADRLLRPVPGPTLSAGERTVPRMVEGYVWGGMTSGGWAKATWALLFPFALANVAHWMLPPTRTGSFASRALSGALRGLLRLSALLLTMLFVAQLAVVGLDLIAGQCLRPGSGCMTFVPEAARQFDVLRAAVGLVPVGLVALLMHRLSSASWDVSSHKPEKSDHSARAPMLPGANIVSDPDTPALRAMHVTAALSTVVLLALGGPLRFNPDPRWVLAAVLVAVALVATALLDDPTGLNARSSKSPLRAALSRTPRRALISLGAVLLASVAAVPPPLDGPLPGSGGTVDVLTWLLLGTCLVVAALLAPAALIAKSAWESSARSLRPWAGGWAAAPMLLLACLLGDGFGAGLALTANQLVGGSELQLPVAYNDVAVFWGTATLLLALSTVVVAPWALVAQWRRRRERDEVPSEVALLHAGRQEDQQAAAGAWRWADLQRRYAHHSLLVLAAVLAISTVVSLVLRLLGLPPAEWAGWLIGLGVASLVGLAAGLLRMVYLAAKRPDAARYLGILCDLTLFWPREAHPVVPPCYALKVIPELAERAAEHLAEPDTRVVLVGHSQGSLLAAVATARLLEDLPEADRERVGLVTAGSQLQWAYPRAFPGVVPHDSLADLAGSLGGRWRSLCRGTDPLGGAVGTWGRQVYDGMLLGVGFRPDGTQGPLSAATRGPTGALVLGGDHWLPDPQRGPFSFRRWSPGVRGHTEYSDDPEWDRAVAMAAGLEIPVRGATLPLHSPAVTPVPPSPRGDARQPWPARGGDGGSLSDGAPRTCGDAEHESAEAAVRREEREAEQETHEQLLAERDQVAAAAPADRPEITELPEVTEPAERTAPWERGAVLRSEH